MKYLKTYKLFEGESMKVDSNTKYFEMDYIVDILQDFIDDGKVEIKKASKYFYTIKCLQIYTNGKQYVSWQTYSEVEEVLKKWNIRNWFANSDKGSDWRSEVYIYDQTLEKIFDQIVGECEEIPSGDGIGVFYVGKADTCHFIKVDTDAQTVPDPQNFNPSYQIGPSKHFVVGDEIWALYQRRYRINIPYQTENTTRLFKHLVERYFGLTMHGSNNFRTGDGYVIDKNDAQRIYRDRMGIDEKKLMK